MYNSTCTIILLCIIIVLSSGVNKNINKLVKHILSCTHITGM